MKLVVNGYMSILIEGVAEAVELARRLGIDVAALEAAIAGGPLDAPIADAKLHKITRGDYAPEFPLEWALKDVDLALAASRRRARVGRAGRVGRAENCRCWPRCPASGTPPSRTATAARTSAPPGCSWRITSPREDEAGLGLLGQHSGHDIA